MRKKTLNELFDNVFWYLVYLLPLIVFVAVICRTGTFVTLEYSLNSCGLGLLTDNPIFSSMQQIFGSAGILPLFSSPDLIIFGSYYVSVFAVHLLVDFCLFIPRLCHKWLTCLYGGDK